MVHQLSWCWVHLHPLSTYLDSNPNCPWDPNFLLMNKLIVTHDISSTWFPTVSTGNLDAVCSPGLDLFQFQLFELCPSSSLSDNNENNNSNSNCDTLLLVRILVSSRISTLPPISKEVFTLWPCSLMLHCKHPWHGRKLDIKYCATSVVSTEFRVISFDYSTHLSLILCDLCQLPSGILSCADIVHQPLTLSSTTAKLNHRG